MAKTKTRIYRIHDKLTGDIVFIRAVTAAGAINWHSRDRFSIAPATPDDMIGVSKESVQDSTVPGVSSGPAAA